MDLPSYLALLGFLAYFALNTGVHENHLFFPALLAVLLIWLQPRTRWPAAAVVAISSINLLLFGGIDGGGLPFSRAVADRWDMALPMALVNVVFIATFWTSEVVAAPARDSSTI